MKTLYKNLFMPASMIPVSILFLLTLSGSVKAQWAQPNVVCYGDPIYLFCGDLVGCDVPGAIYTWSNVDGTWYSNDKNPVIQPGNTIYHEGSIQIYLSIQFYPDGLSSGVLTVILLNPFQVSGTASPLSCNGANNGSITITPAGGQPSYGPYHWSNGATTKNLAGLSIGTYTVTVTDANNCTASNSFAIVQSPALTITKTGGSNVSCAGSSNGSLSISASGGGGSFSYLWNTGGTSPGISNLYAGGYTVTVTDITSCTKVQSWIVTQPAALYGNGVVSNISCNGGNNGAATISAMGGTPPYTYKWSNGPITATITGLTAGRYTVTITDFNNCVSFTWMDVTQPSDITIAGTPVKVACQGGSNGKITTTVSGGSGGATTYLWNNGQTGATAINLVAGTYTVTVTNSSGCNKSKSFTVTENSAITISTVAISPALCYNSNDGSIQPFVGGGATPYSYLWNNGQTTATAINLTAGTYTVTITDAGPCTRVGSWLVTAPSALTVTGIQTNILCNGLSNGRIDITASGGTPPYSYNWNVTAYQGQGTAHVSGLYAGVYTVTVTDNNLCSKIQSWIITQPTALIANGVVTNVTCYGGNNGSITISAFGGTYPYSYLWSTGSTAQTITGLAAGRYTVTVTDAVNCFTYTWQDILQPSAISVTGTPVKATCPGSSNGQITTVVSGGSGGTTTYLWNNGQTGSTANNLTVGTYTVTVTNAAGCKVSSLPIYVGSASLLPAQAGAVSGPDFVGKGQTGVIFSITPVANATGYVWNLPPGAIIADASDPTNIRLNFPVWASSGNISVYGTNDCGQGVPSPDHHITVIAMNAALQNITPGTGNTCYDAIQTIYVAGGGSTFIVNGGASVTMIAGQNIVYQAGTDVNPGGYLHGYIAVSGQYCAAVFNPVVNSPVQGGTVQTVPEIVTDQNIRIYPNPTSGSFTLELTGSGETGIQKVEIYGMDGVRVLNETAAGEHKHSFSAESLRPGIYIIHVTTGTTNGMLKLIRL